MRKTACVALILAGAMDAAGSEKAAYDSRGRLIALLTEGGEVEVVSDYVAVLPNGRRVS